MVFVFSYLHLSNSQQTSARVRAIAGVGKRKKNPEARSLF